MNCKITKTLGFALAWLSICSSGCNLFSSLRPIDAPYVQDTPKPAPSGAGMPVENNKIALPTYRVAPPDILLIDAVQVMPKEPYLLQPLDVLQVIIENAAPGTEITEPIAVSPGGEVNLGPAYGKVSVKGLSTEEAAAEIEKKLRAILTNPHVALTILQASGQEQIVGEHIIAPDGTVNLGTYGQVYVAGMTLVEIRAAIEKHLEQYLEDPKISVDIFAYNTMVYYIIIENAGQGEQVVALPITGNETVLEAIASVGGTSQFSNKNNMWIARPAPSHVGCDQILPIKWTEITRGGSADTNYQILPGDRIYIAADRFIAFDSLISKVTSPFERIFGFNLLASQTLHVMQRFPKGISATGF